MLCWANAGPTRFRLRMKISAQPQSRRQFIRTVVAASTAAMAAPYVRTADRTGAHLPVVGTGEHVYECIHDWGELPSGIVYGNTHGVAQDAMGFIHVLHTVHASSPRGDAVVVFDPAGRFVRSWGAEFRGGAHGMHLARENGREYFYLCDTVRRLLVKTTLAGEVIWTRGCPFETGLYKQLDEYRPTNVATAPDGTVFVADGYGRNFIHVYHPDGSYQRSFGGTGDGPGRLSVPHGLMVDTRGEQPRLVVADRKNRRLQYFSLDGRALAVVTEELRQPCHFDQRGPVLLIPDLKSRVTLFDGQDRLITHLGDGGDFIGLRTQPRTAFTPGRFVAPHSAIFGHDGDIFVVEWVEVGRVTRLRRIV